MQYIDIHSHLDFEIFDENRDELVRKIEEEKVKVYSNTLNPKNYKYARELFKNTSINVCPGFYPKDIAKAKEEDLTEFFNILETEKYDLVGEIGLDKNFYDKEEEVLFEKQVEYFKKILDYTFKNQIPIVIHTRKAEGEVLEILENYIKEYKFNKVCLHCFTGKKKFYSKIKELGIYCSIPLMVLNLVQFQELVKFLPTSKLLVETDSPFLHPKKEINTPLNVFQIYDKIAELKGYDKIEIINIIYRNYQRFIN